MDLGWVVLVSLQTCNALPAVSFSGFSYLRGINRALFIFQRHPWRQQLQKLLLEHNKITFFPAKITFPSSPCFGNCSFQNVSFSGEERGIIRLCKLEEGCKRCWWFWGVPVLLNPRNSTPKPQGFWVHCLGFCVLAKKPPTILIMWEEKWRQALKDFALIKEEITEGTERVLIWSEYICIWRKSAHTEITAQFYIWEVTAFYKYWNMMMLSNLCLTRPGFFSRLACARSSLGMRFGPSPGASGTGSSGALWFLIHKHPLCIPSKSKGIW